MNSNNMTQMYSSLTLGSRILLPQEIRHGEHCRMPLGVRPPEAYFEPQGPLSFSADIWSLTVTMWEILGMKALFSNEYITQDEMVSEHIDVLGPMPQHWFESWKECGEFFPS